MDTIGKRMELLEEQMVTFEKGRDYSYIAGFYAALVQQLATDREQDFDYVMRILKYNSVPEKYQK